MPAGRAALFRHTKIAALAVLALIVAHDPAQARTPACPAATGLRPEVTLTVPEVTREHGWTLSDLAAADLPGLHTHDRNFHRVGLTRSVARIGYSYRYAFAQIPSGACARVTHFEIDLEITDLIVYIAAEVPKNSCSWRAVDEHERRHVTAEIEIARHLRPQIAAYASNALERLGPVRAPTPQAANRRIRSYLDDAMSQVMREFGDHRDAAHARIDTPEEYARLSRVCDGELSRILGKALRRARR